ncbi:hypothetical protein XcodCFBP4690_02260 [Xanthomonas codiaei]|uniref:Uncharacterized protein n=1 Tax=Xanthomonas codiaei TaxID=56463 RepID=A0A2S7CXU7_9XANT|nr:hypothetical protein XcodCFBP4690_02260 [Xanthomonas codiaei]
MARKPCLLAPAGEGHESILRRNRGLKCSPGGRVARIASVWSAIEPKRPNNNSSTQQRPSRLKPFPAEMGWGEVRQCCGARRHDDGTALPTALRQQRKLSTHPTAHCFSCRSAYHKARRAMS